MGRVDRSVARHLGLSRQAATDRFRARRVARADGTPLSGHEHLDAGATVLVDGAPVVLVEHVHVLLHKPLGCVTALSDPSHPVAVAYVADAPCPRDLRAIGRLDLDTSGLLLWTTDGARVQAWAHPRRAVPRTYHAALAGPYRDAWRGLVLRDGTAPDIAEVAPIVPEAAHPALDRRGAEHLATITIRTGAYHEVRRIFAALGTEVVGLARVAFGPFALPHDLPAGQWRAIDLPPAPGQ